MRRPESPVRKSGPDTNQDRARVVIAEVVSDLLETPHRHERCDRIEKRPESAECQAGCNGRSEEHTSELQSLMRISYAVFCLKKKKKQTKKKHHIIKQQQTPP